MSKAPKLRFKEFSGDWEEKKLEEIFTMYAGGDLNKEIYSKEKTEEHIYPVYSNGLEDNGLYGYYNVYKETKNKITVTARGVNIGSINVRKNNFTAVGRLLVLNPIDSLNCNLDFFKYNMSQNIRLIKEETGVPQLTAPSYAKYSVSVTSKEEQEKIASFFSLIDEKISLQGEKVEALKDYKRGMMQKIFSRELRFKDDEGRDYPEWEVTTIEKVADLEKGFTPDTKNEKNWGGDTPWLSIADMKQGKYISDVSKHISYEALGNKKLVPKGTLIMSFKLTLGRLGIINTEMMTNEAICHFYWKNKNINTEYMYYYLSTVNIESFGCRAAKGITLNNDSLNSIVVKLPIIEEQNKIANILIKIDNKIDKEQEKLNSLNEYKKGLLQQMFV